MKIAQTRQRRTRLKVMLGAMNHLKGGSMSLNQPLQSSLVLAGSLTHIGFLYMQNDRVVILLNNLAEKADLGPLRRTKHNHIEPEADILILPRRQVDAIQILE